MSTLSINVSRTNVKSEVLADFKNVILKVDYFWDSHGKLVLWNDCVEDPTYWSGVDVQLVSYSFTEHLLGKDFDFDFHQLWVNGKQISGDVINCKVKTDFIGVTTLYCRVAVGWG